MSERVQVDWERVELDYRAGILTLREMAKLHGVSHTAIKKKADKEGWERDLSARVKAKADALVSKELVSKEVSSEQKVTEQRHVEIGARVLADVVLEHHSSIRRGRTLVMSLLSELEMQTGDISLYQQLSDLLKFEDESTSDKRRELLAKVIALPARTKVMKDLADSLRTLIGLEREAFGIGEPEPPPQADNAIDMGRASDLRALIRGRKTD